MTQNIMILGFSIVLNLGLVFGQGNRNRSNVPPVGRGQVDIIIDAALPPMSLQELVDQSDRIVDATVVRLLASRQTQADDPASLETDFVISSAKTLKGATGVDVLVSQLGGERNGLRAQTPQIPLLRSGGRYIFFLVKDDRTTLPDYNALPRYIITGVWSGVFEVIGNVPHTNKNAAPAIRAAVENLDVNQFLSKVSALVR
jgi:hypothetical protein